MDRPMIRPGMAPARNPMTTRKRLIPRSWTKMPLVSSSQKDTATSEGGGKNLASRMPVRDMNSQSARISSGENNPRIRFCRSLSANRFFWVSPEDTASSAPVPSRWTTVDRPTT
jgi:hypothetical protein